MSPATTRAPARERRFASCEPTCPRPTTATVLPLRSREPKRRRTQARIAASTPPPPPPPPPPPGAGGGGGGAPPPAGGPLGGPADPLRVLVDQGHVARA